MALSLIDWVFVVLLLLFSLLVGIWGTRRAGSSSSEFFLSGRSMPWWLLGISMVATTFSSDTPNLVADIVRQHGVAGNWVWWAFLLTGMMTVFVYARLWRRSGVMTDLEFYELRYSGKEAAFLRGFRAIYLGVFFNILILACVCLGWIKISGAILGIPPLSSLLTASLITVIYSSLGGLRSVILTDFLQFTVAMIGSIGAAVYVINLPEVGGLTQLLSHPLVQSKLSIWPDFSDPNVVLPLFAVPLVVQWWSSWYPGAEPGGGGYIAQRMLSAKNENHAVAATFLFNLAHYAIRPWPWILVALASLVIYPTVGDLGAAFPHIPKDKLGEDLSYPVMLTHLPAGLLGIVMASLLSAFMSTISTHLNWGSSYIVHDVYKRFIHTDASEKEMVFIGRISTIVMMAVSCCVAFFMTNAKQVFDIILMVGAGTGLLFILRWFWWRINPASEIAAMVISFAVSIYFTFIFDRQVSFAGEVPEYVRFCMGITVTTIGWILATLLTRPSDTETLKRFCLLVHPGGPGWKRIIDQLPPEQKMEVERSPWTVPQEILCMILGCVSVYCLLFTMGYLIYGNWLGTGFSSFLAIISALGLYRIVTRRPQD